VVMVTKDLQFEFFRQLDTGRPQAAQDPLHGALSVLPSGGLLC
jgi:hypothetical protein